MANATNLKSTGVVSGAEVRAWAVEKEIPVGSRGRLDAETVILPFLVAHPKTAKEIAAKINFSLPSRGNARQEALVTLAETLV